MRKYTKKTSTAVEDLAEDIINSPNILPEVVTKSIKVIEPVNTKDQSVIYKVGNITINRVSLEQLKRAAKEKDISHIIDFLEVFIREAEKNETTYSPVIEPVVSDKTTKTKKISYMDNEVEKYMVGETIDIHDEISPDNHIKRITRLVVDQANTNIDIPVGSILTTPDKRFAIIKRNSQTVYESIEYLR